MPFGFENSVETQFFPSWKRFTTMVRMLSAGRFLFWVGWDMLQIPFHEPNSSKFPSKMCLRKKTLPLRQNWASLTFDHDHKAANRILDNPAPMSSQWFSSVPTARYRSLRLSRPAALLLLMCLVATRYSRVRYFFFFGFQVTHTFKSICKDIGM